MEAADAADDGIDTIELHGESPDEGEGDGGKRSESISLQ